MLYFADDVLKLFRAVPHWTLRRPQSAQKFLDRVARDGEELRHLLAEYPEQRYEPLDHFYVSLQCVGAANEGLITDLCTNYGRIGAVRACWLATLAPDPRYHRPIESLLRGSEEERWFAEFALAEMAGVTMQAHVKLHAAYRRVRSLISQCPLPQIELRRAPSEQEVVEFYAEAERVREAYHRDGADEALGVLRSSSCYKFI